MAKLTVAKVEMSQLIELGVWVP